MPIERRVIALDTECDTVKNAQGQPIGKMRDSVIQLAYEHADGKIRALVVQLKGKTLHPRLLALLGDPTITFCGSNVSADLKKLGKDFGCQRTTQRAQRVNLGMMARKSDVVPSGMVSLDRLVAVCLGQRLEKDPSVRLSLWSSPRLTPMQVKYAALDALKSLEVYFHLLPLPDLTVRLASGATDGWFQQYHKAFAGEVPRAGAACCAADTVAFHYVEGDEPEFLWRVLVTERARFAAMSQAELDAVYPAKLGPYAHAPAARATALWELLREKIVVRDAAACGAPQVHV